MYHAASHFQLEEITKFSEMATYGKDFKINYGLDS